MLNRIMRVMWLAAAVAAVPVSADIIVTTHNGKGAAGGEHVISIGSQSIAFASEPSLSVSLEGQWKFIIDPANAGIQKGWNKPEYNDAAWGVINVPGLWEDQGYTQENPNWTEDRLKRPYSGYAWYRRTIIVPADWKGRKIFLNLGYIDDFDWTYVNGTMVGSTTTIGQAASDIARSYPVPEGTVKFGQPNLIVVRVLDKLGDGGITRGPATLTADTPLSYTGRPAGGRSGSDAVRVGTSVVVEKGVTARDATSVMGNVRVRGHVTGDAVAVLGTVTIEPGGRVDGDAVAVAGSVTIEPGGRVDGDAVAVAGSVHRRAGATIGGSVTQVGSAVALPSIPGWSGIPGLPGGSTGTAMLGGFILSLLFAVVAAVVVALFPDRMEMMAAVILEHPGQSFGAALAGGLAILLISGALTITLIGIPLVLVVGLFTAGILLAGNVAVRLAVGVKLVEAAGQPAKPMIVCAVIGSVVLALLKLVPYAGMLVLVMLSLLGFGAVVATGFGKRPDWLARRLGWQAPPPPNIPEARPPLP